MEASAPLIDERHFVLIKTLLYENAGITLADHKRQMVQNRIAKRLKDIKANDIDDYIALLNADREGEEMGNLINALTTNVTYFFREDHHFGDIQKRALSLAQAGQKEIRIWSAGCSIGAEPYSIVIALSEMLATHKLNARIKILATDIDTKALAHARGGRYSDSTIKGLSKERLGKFFTLSKNREGDAVYTVVPSIRQKISFNHLNLNHPKWPMSQLFDFVFCRNVLIYFDRDKQRQFVGHMTDYLKEGGAMYLGHSEHASVTPGMGLKSLGQTIYVKTTI